MSLDIPPINASLKHNFILYVTRQENSIGLVGFVQPRIPLSGVVPLRIPVAANTARFPTLPKIGNVSES